MGKKITFLVLALLLPAMVFVFLKIFGRNEFQVPVLHVTSIPERVGACDGVYKTPYHIPDSVVETLGLNAGDSLYVFNFDSRQDEALDRVSAEFKNEPVAVLNRASMDPGIKTDFLRRCILLMHKDSSAAIVDNRHRIRGYYDPRDRDEVDRMIVEIKIILKQY